MALRQSVSALAASLMSIVRTRLELFVLEASEQKSNLIQLIGLAFVGLLFVTLAVLVFSIAVALYFWPSDYRYTALFVLALVYAVLALIFFLLVRRTLAQVSDPFSATLEELQRDIALVEDLAHSKNDAQHHSSPGAS